MSSRKGAALPGGRTQAYPVDSRHPGLSMASRREQHIDHILRRPVVAVSSGRSTTCWSAVLLAGTIAGSSR